jgi:hypothetical protein
LNGLNEDQNRNRADDNPFCLDTSHRRVSPKGFEINIACANYRRMFATFALGLQVPGPRTSAKRVNLKLEAPVWHPASCPANPGAEL